MIESRPHTRCRACSAMLPSAFLDLGRQPLANNLCTLSDHCDETFPMRLARCAACGLLQLDVVIDPAQMFSHYLYTPSQSRKTMRHFERLADEVSERVTGHFSQRRPRVVDVGSNDGALLRMFRARGWNVCGIDPAENLAAQANADGLETVIGFLDDSAAVEVLARHNHVDVVTACNVFAHTPDWETFARCASRLLAADGILVIEFPYGPTMLRDATFDLVYFEHASYPTVRAASWPFSRYGLTVYDVEHLPDVHGGSVRLWLGRSRSHLMAPNVDAILQAEDTSASEDACRAFVAKVDRTKRELIEAVRRARRVGRRVVGYTAPAKAVTLLQACALGPGDVSFILDDNPLKQGRLLPVSHIPIRAPSDVEIGPSDTVIVFAWNVVEDIASKLPAGVDIIVPMPSVRLVKR